MPHNHLPGNLSDDAKVKRMIRVDHAGEYGAKRIYEGQLAVLGNSPAGETIRHMAAQEQRHLETFERMIVERRVRPTLLHPLWHIGAFALGAATALLGEKAAMACTVAVEETIDQHYRAQEAALDTGEAALKATIADFRAEELEHRDAGLAHGAETAIAYPILHRAISTATRTAIWLSERI